VSIDLGSTVAGVRLPFCVMNASGSCTTPRGLRRLAASGSGAIVLLATVHPFVHPEFRTLRNPGYDKLVPLVRELVAAGRAPVMASVAGASAEEYVLLARAFADAGAALIEVNLFEPWVSASLAAFEQPAVLPALLERLARECPLPVVVKLPDRPLAWAAVGRVLAATGVRAVAVANGFACFERFLLDGGEKFDVIAFGDIASGYDVSRALSKGARAVQVVEPLAREGPRVFARLEHEMRVARGER
jgi:dihydroorotate dehydrogenase